MRIFMKCLALLLGCSLLLNGQDNENRSKFRQLKQELATPNVYHNAAGAPGQYYYQQRADYQISVELDDEKQRISGSEVITYYNNSPDELSYLWIQLDQNMRAKDSDRRKTATATLGDSISFRTFMALHNDFDGGFKIEYVRDKNNRPLQHQIVSTMMRIDPTRPLKPGQSTVIKIKWWYNINDRMKMGGRSGYEYFEEDGNYLYTIAQFFPRMAVYNAVEGWQHKQFLGRGEFALEFGDYDVKITVPADHLLAATGELQNPASVLSAKERRRLQRARTASEPVIIRSQEEAVELEKGRSTQKKTWHFRAKNVRDFAFATSRKFIWDAMGVQMGNGTVMAMSYYPKEGNPLWEQYSTKVVAHTLKTYSKYTFDYPYPVAISVHAARIGMEYPMICFNFGRPNADGTYSKRTKYRMIGVIIHEIGHNYFPMIVNSDERQWTWMDEGLNSFLQYLTEQEWEHDFPSRRGPAHKIVDYMKGDKNNIVPIMTNSESIHQFGNNAYGKPATALNILRESVMGRELFDFAFKVYSQRWMFKHPTPADFFRTMEDASGVDLDWYWRGWFYTTDHVDISLDAVSWFRVDSRNPEVEKPIARADDAAQPEYITDVRNRDLIKKTLIEQDASLQDFYNRYDPYESTILDREEYEKYLTGLDDEQRELLNSDLNYYQLDFTNHGGLVMPLILEYEYSDGTKEIERVPAEVWRYRENAISRVITSEKEIVAVTLDPFLETADVDISNNYWPPRAKPSRFKLFKQRRLEDRENPMQRLKRADERTREITGKDTENSSSGGQE